MKTMYPTMEEAERILAEGGEMNPGPWVLHAKYAALAAKDIAECCEGMNCEKAYVLGLLHDIGVRFGVSYMKHVLHGYRYCMGLGYDAAAKICLTHSFPAKNINEAFGRWDYCTEEEYNFITKYIEEAEYDEYDILIQLCDALALPSGFTLIEKRMIDVALRHGITKPDFIIQKWKKTFEIKAHFEDKIGRSIYDVLPGVVENTFT